MRKTKKAIALALFTSFLFLNVPPIANPPPVRADDSDIFGANIQPNVLLMLDTSGSMEDLIFTEPFDKDKTYSGTNATGKVFQRTTPPTVYSDSIADVQNANAKNSLSTVGFWQGKIGGSSVSLATGNYLNFLASPAGQPVKKIDVAKRVLKNLINNTEGVRFGVMKFADNQNKGQGGGEIVAPIGSDKATMTSGIDAMPVAGFTPLGEITRDAGKYYRGEGDYWGRFATSPIQLECQPNFAILMSDGLQNGSLQVQAEAAQRKNEDHSNSLPGRQNVIVHTVGFAVDATDVALGANDILQQGAKNGGGTFYSTENEAQLAAALENAIRQIVAATFAFAAPLIPTTSATGSIRAYLASFQSDPSRPAWKGFLEAYNRDSKGSVRVKADGTPDDDFRAWEAGEALAAKSASSRTIYTNIRGGLQDFRTSNGNITAAMLGVATDADKNKLIEYIRGIDTYDEDADGNVTEERAWKLGDIFHSAPVLVTPPFLPIPLIDPAPSYKDFKAANANRETVLIAGGNDGMLHAIRESDGQELWAFIPNDLLGSLKTLTATSAAHPFYVDGSPIAADVKIGGTWKTILVIGERRGGRFYHALDITDTTKPLYLWSFTDSKMGETWSEPAIGKVKMADGTERYVAIVGGGYDTTQNNNSGKALFGIDVATGQKLFEYFNTGSASDDRRFMNFSLPANPTAVDLNRDGFIDGVYIGDVGGQLWKYDFSPPATLSGGLVTNWTGKRFFAAPLVGTNPPAAGEYYPTQAIYGAPVPALDKINNLWIFFGAGDRNHPNNTTAPNRFYGIKDDTTMANGSTLTEANLANITASDTTPTQGWFFLLGSDEKILAAADVFNLIVFFSSFTPTTTAACETGGGTAKLYAVQMLTGYAALDWSLGVALTSTSASATRGKIIGTGIPSRPITVITESEATISTSVIAATTSQQLPSNPAPPPSAMRKVLYWREVF
jgi:type IV pilus assembly protein PilY1